MPKTTTNNNQKGAVITKVSDCGSDEMLPLKTVFN